MARGSDLSPQQIRRAIEYNRRRGDRRFIVTIQSKMGLTANGRIDEAFVRGVADWQETNLGPGQGDGWVGPATEANLNIVLSEALRAVQAAIRMHGEGRILFDSWGNDFRDNNMNGLVDQDDGAESADDGAHYAGTYPCFALVEVSRDGGWDFARRRVTVTAAQVGTVTGPFKYRVCADVISEAYHAARVMEHVRSTSAILGVFRSKGYVWQRSVSYPTRYLPGDFICTLGAHGGHSAIVVEESLTDGGRLLPVVVELPGPSTQISDGTYNPASTNDIQRHLWSSFRVVQIAPEYQFLGRLLYSRLHRPS